MIRMPSGTRHLLTTRMEEADVLGDRICIMSRGKIQALDHQSILSKSLGLNPVLLYSLRNPKAMGLAATQQVTRMILNLAKVRVQRSFMRGSLALRSVKLRQDLLSTIFHALRAVSCLHSSRTRVRSIALKIADPISPLPRGGIFKSFTGRAPARTCSRSGGTKHRSGSWGAPKCKVLSARWCTSRHHVGHTTPSRWRSSSCHCP